MTGRWSQGPHRIGTTSWLWGAGGQQTPSSEPAEQPSHIAVRPQTGFSQQVELARGLVLEVRARAGVWTALVEPARFAGWLALLLLMAPAPVRGYGAGSSPTFPTPTFPATT